MNVQMNTWTFAPSENKFFSEGKNFCTIIKKTSLFTVSVNIRNNTWINLSDSKFSNTIKMY